MGIVANPALNGLKEFLRRAIAALEGNEVVLEECIAGDREELGVCIDKFDVDAIVTIGGDGTVLYTLQNIPRQVPVLSVRAGMLGFLTEIDKSDLEEGIERLLSGKHEIEERTRISSMIDGKKLPDALNEVVIHTSQVAKLRQFNIKIDRQLVSRVKADGLIIATPTGSTSYALSVGAPIIDPRLGAFVIAPVAPLWQLAKTMVVPDDSRIQITIEEPRPCSVVADGRDETRLEGGERLEIFKSPEPARFVRFDKDFFGRMREKLSEAARLNATKPY